MRTTWLASTLCSSIKNTDEGSVQLRARLADANDAALLTSGGETGQHSDEKRLWIVFEVEDTGGGVPEQ